MTIKISNRCLGTHRSPRQFLNCENLQEIFHCEKCYFKIHYLKRQSLSWLFAGIRWELVRLKIKQLNETNAACTLTFHFYQYIQCFDILLWPIFIWPHTTILVDRSAFCWTMESIYIKNLDLGLTAIRRDCSELKDSSQQSSQNATYSLQDTLNYFSKAQKQGGKNQSSRIQDSWANITYQNLNTSSVVLLWLVPEY